MYLVSISYGGFVLVKDFDSSGACLMMASDGYYCVLACRSLACPATLALYSSPALPPWSPVEAIGNASVCDRGCALEVCRRRVVTEAST
jgi:hypothetical protein